LVVADLIFIRRFNLQSDSGQIMGGVLLTIASYKGNCTGAIEKANIREGCSRLWPRSEIKFS